MAALSLPQSMLSFNDSDSGTNRFQAAMRLDLSKPVLMGRENEIDLINAAAADTSTNMVFISGPSGVGKSLLAKACFKESVVVGVGQVDQSTSNSTPFYAVAKAIDAAIQQILQRSTGIQEISNHLHELLGDELGRLTPLMPHLGELIRESDASSETFSVGSASEKNASTFGRLKYLFFVLLDALSSHEYERLVLVIDDIHWIDTGCLDLLQYLTDEAKPINNVLFIMTYRPDEIGDEKTAFLQNVKSHKAVEIVLANISRLGVNDLLSHYLEIRQEETSELADLIFKKTAGNPFFVTQFIQALQDERLLVYSVQGYKWTWNMKSVQEKMRVSDNIVDLVQCRINKLPADGNIAIQLAACLGSHFRADIFEGVVEFLVAEKKPEPLFDTLKALDVNMVLDLLVGLGLIEERTLEGWYQFVHDRIQQSSYLLVQEPAIREQLHLYIGKFLCKQLAESGTPEDWLLFGAVDQLNKASKTSTSRVDLAKINFQAAERARLLSAFWPSSEYALCASHLLNGNHKWTENYDLALNVSNLAAQVCHSAGKNRDSSDIIQEVIDHARTHSDSLKVRLVEMTMLGQDGRLAKAICLGKEIVRQQGLTFPSRTSFFRMVRSVMTTSSKVLSLRDSEVLALPTCKDKAVVEVSKVLESIASFSYLVNLKKTDVAMASALNVQIMLEHGVTPNSAPSLVMFGVCLLAIGRFDDCCRLSSLALRLATRRGHDTALAAVMFTSQFLTMHFQKPIQSSLESCLLGYRAGMRVGDAYWSSCCVTAYCMAYYMSGLPLQPLSEDMKNYLPEMAEYGQNTVRTSNLPIFQKIINLIDENREDPLDFTTQIINEREYVAQSKAANNLLALKTLFYCKAELAYTWGRFDEAGEILSEYETLDPAGDKMPSIAFIRETFFRGLINIALARLHGKRRKYKTRYRKSIAMLRTWTEASNVNCVDVLMLLLAEAKSLTSRDPSVVMPMYDKSISSAARTGFVQIEALGCECYARYLLSQDNESKARDVLQRAYQCYVKWGATTKVRQMETVFDFDFDFQESNEMNTGCHFSGQKRFDGKSSSAHKKLRISRPCLSLIEEAQSNS